MVRNAYLTIKHFSSSLHFLKTLHRLSQLQRIYLIMRFMSSLIENKTATQIPWCHRRRTPQSSDKLAGSVNSDLWLFDSSTAQEMIYFHSQEFHSPRRTSRRQMRNWECSRCRVDDSARKNKRSPLLWEGAIDGGGERNKSVCAIFGSRLIGWQLSSGGALKTVINNALHSSA